ncbi:ATP-binding protein [Phaeovulum sp.]|uniref:ATP-binding protein n=1 Tax=Phaeovulum sp. TaxID=2934796 RepID=UPI0039E228DB
MLADQTNGFAPGTRPSARLAPQIFHHSFPADPLSVRAALQTALNRFARQITPEEAGTLELVLAEVLNNIVEHGYRDREYGTIVLSIVRDRKGLSCSVSDDGITLPADCLHTRRNSPDRPSPTLLPEGGFGWFLIHDLADHFGYRRENNQNLLAFRLPLSG